MTPSPQYKFLRQSVRDGLSFNQNISRWDKLHLDPWLLGFLIINTILGLLMVYSASSEDISMVVRQGISFAVGFVLLFICAQIPPKVYQAVSPWFYLFAILLLILVLLVGDVRLGAKRWLTIPGIGSMQPSEFMKFAMPLMMAWFFARNPYHLSLDTLSLHW